MKVRNLTAKPIGFGSVVILPDQLAETPKGYGRDHPTVKYYLSRRWIAEVGAEGNIPTGLNVNVNVGDPGAPGGSSHDNKPIDRMNKDELQSLAFAQGIELAETDTRQVIIDKIKAAKNANA